MHVEKRERNARVRQAVVAGFLVVSVLAFVLAVATREYSRVADSARTTLGWRVVPGQKGTAVVDHRSGWGSESYRVRLIMTYDVPLHDPSESGIGTVICPWGAMRVYSIKWTGPAELCVSGSKSTNTGWQCLDRWEGVRIVYDSSGQ